MSKAGKFFKEFNFLDFCCCFSARIQQSSKTFNIELHYVIFACFFDVCFIIIEKQRQKPRKLSSLINFASLDTQPDPQVARLVEIYPVTLCFETTAAPSIISSWTSKINFEIYIHDLITICSVFILIIGQKYI